MDERDARKHMMRTGMPRPMERSIAKSLRFWGRASVSEYARLPGERGSLVPELV